MCAGGLQLLDPMSAAILIQYLQQMPLAPLTGSKVAMYMGNMNGAVPPQYAACNGTEDQASSHIVLMNMLMVTKLSAADFKVRLTLLLALVRATSDLLLQALWYAPTCSPGTSLSDKTPHRLPVFQSLSCWQ